MNYFLKILRFGIPYRRYAFLNIFFNIFYALFSAMAYIAMIPMMQILFGTTQKTYIKPKFQGLTKKKSFLEDFFNYKVTQYQEDDIGSALLFVIGMNIILFFLKNIFNY